MRRTVIPDETDLRGARVRPPLALSARDGRRSTERAGDDDTRSFLEQIGQFSTSRLWRQKVGTKASLRTTKGARWRAPFGNASDGVSRDYA
jgi:hypothetical protein